MTSTGDEEMPPQFSPQKYTLNLADQMTELNEVTEKYKAISENPFLFSQIFLGLKAAMENFNSLLVDLNIRLTEIDKRLNSLETDIPSQTTPEIGLSKKDHEILDFVMTRAEVTAEDVQKKLGYKGKNAASSRLHKLYSVGALSKIHSGRTVYYKAPKPPTTQEPK